MTPNQLSHTYQGSSSTFEWAGLAGPCRLGGKASRDRTLTENLTAGQALRWKWHVSDRWLLEGSALFACFFGSGRWSQAWTGHHSCSLSSLFPSTKAVSRSPNYCQQCLPFTRKIETEHAFHSLSQAWLSVKDKEGCQAEEGGGG